MLDLKKIRAQFPILQTKVHDKPLVYLDNAATTQKPLSVIQALTTYYQTQNANIHRGVHTLSELATSAYESSRKTTAQFINAPSEKSIIFTRNCTESINLVASTWGQQNIHSDDEIIISAMEHHANLIPWQELAKRKNAKLKIIPIRSDYTLDLETYQDLLTPKTKLVAISGMSNSLGTINDLETIIQSAKKAGALTLVDAAQLICHRKIDVQTLDCDFLAFSGHKLMGPTGIGILYGKLKLLESMPPFLFGGEMIKTVSFERSLYQESPWKFEAGTPNIAGAIALKPALELITEIGQDNILAHEKALLQKAHAIFSKYPQVKLHCPPLDQAGSVLSFTVDGIHSHDLASIFDSEGVAIRAGNHCTEPLMTALNLPGGTARISFYLYNEHSDITQAEKALKKALKIFQIT